MTLPRPSRWFVADDILSGAVRLDGYPFTFIYITPRMAEMVHLPFSSQPTYPQRADKVFTAAEILESQGWQVISFDVTGPIAYLRRHPPH